MYINTSGKLVKNTSNIVNNTDSNDEPKAIPTSNEPLSVSPTSVSPTRIFPDTDFFFNHTSSFLGSNTDKNDSLVPPPKKYPSYNNKNIVTTTGTHTTTTTITTTKNFPNKLDTYNNNRTERKNSISSLEFIKRPKRINEFNQRSKDDDLIKLNTEKNRYISSRSKSLPFNSLKLKSSLKLSNGHNVKPVRSKSVHFDELLPIKYFHKYECPTCVSRQNSDCEVIAKINFDTVKPLHRYHSDSDSDTENDISDYKEDGLYDMNFAVLNSTSNNKDLKLNIFVNNQNGSNIMLQSIKLEKRRSYNNFFDYFMWGKVSVKNIFYEKYIYIRYTFNHWETFNEVKAQYVQDLLLKSNWANYDTFEFTLYNLKNLLLSENGNHQIPDSFLNSNNNNNNNNNVIEGDLEFCIHYETKDPNRQEMLEFWDNNNGKNYKIHLVLHTQDNNNEDNERYDTSDNLHSNKTKHTDGDDEYLMFETDKYFNIANELGGFTKKNKKSLILNDDRRRSNSIFLDDLLDEKNFLQLDEFENTDSRPTNSKLYNFNNIKANKLLLPQDKNHELFGNSSDEDDDEDYDGPLFFKDFRNPFAN